MKLTKRNTNIYDYRLINCSILLVYYSFGTSPNHQIIGTADKMICPLFDNHKLIARRHHLNNTANLYTATRKV